MEDKESSAPSAELMLLPKIGIMGKDKNMASGKTHYAFITRLSGGQNGE